MAKMVQITTSPNAVTEEHVVFLDDVFVGSHVSMKDKATPAQRCTMQATTAGDASPLFSFIRLT